MDGIYLSIELGDQQVKHTFYPKYTAWSSKLPPMKREEADAAIECFIKKCHALFEFRSTLEEIE